MNSFWWSNEFLTGGILVFIWIFQLNYMSCLSLNHEGNALLKFKERVVDDPFGALSSWKEENGEVNPCSWFGVGCAGGHVVSLNLKNLCLEGTLGPEFHHLLHIKSIILRNNSFSGIIPSELRNLKNLELLDLGYNNFRQPIPLESEYNIPILLLDNKGLFCHLSPEEHLDENHRTSTVEVLQYYRHNSWPKDAKRSRMLAGQIEGQVNSPDSISKSGLNSHAPNINDKPSPPSPPSPQPNLSVPPPFSDSRPPPFSDSRPPPPPQPNLSLLTPFSDSRPPPLTTSSSPPPLMVPSSSNPPSPNPPRSPNNSKIIGAAVGGAGGFIALGLVFGLFYLLRNKKMNSARGLSGQLQKAFVAGNDRSDGYYSDKPSFLEGIPNLKRSELVTACEDFSNVIGSSSIGTIYKGTLSNGVEIAVISLVVTSAKDWSKNLETQFRKKIENLSKVNHKNFVNLIGYCEEEEPFTRLMVFEYAPNGSLFEHLHVREAEHLDWGMRLRVAMGMAYCLEHMHQLTPPVTHPNLNSSAVSLSEDYAAKISDFCFWNEVAAQVQPMVTNSLSTLSVSSETNVFSFGLVLLEMMTGKIPHSLQNNSLDDWVSEYMNGEQPLQELVDPMLRRFDPDQLDNIGEVIRKCLHSEQNRPTMRDITLRLREVTGINQDKAAPRFSSLWWAELDARSVNET